MFDWLDTERIVGRLFEYASATRGSVHLISNHLSKHLIHTIDSLPPYVSNIPRPVGGASQMSPFPPIGTCLCGLHGRFCWAPPCACAPLSHRHSCILFWIVDVKKRKVGSTLGILSHQKAAHSVQVVDVEDGVRERQRGTIAVVPAGS